MDNLDADFIINNNDTIETEYLLNENDPIKCSFELFASGTVWGSIDGTLSNQTDLQDALDDLSDSITANHDAIGDIGQTIGTYGDIVTYNAADFATAAQGALAESAVQSVTTGNTNGTLSVDGTSVSVYGLGSAAYTSSSDYATAAQGTLASTAVQPGNLATVATSGSYNDLINKPTIPTVNDGTLTIQANGVDVATFSANQSGNTVANLVFQAAAEWGTITGTLSDQSDLQNALNAKQDSLTAGTGIDITSGTISVTSPVITNNATGTNAFAVGKNSQSTAEGGVAVGCGARANSTYATAIGEDTRANNTNTTVIGRAAKATEARAIAIGSGAEANAQDAIAIKGINNTANTFQIYTYNMLDMSTGLIPDARISSNIARTADIPSLTNYVTTNTAQTISASKAFSQPLVIADNNGLASGTILSNKKILQRSSGDNALTLNNKDNKLRLVGSETRPKYSADGSTFGDMALYSDITAITDLIPAAASVSNQLADQQFVNDSISTNTADFDGSWATYADIPSTVAGFTSENLPEPSNNNYLVVLADETQDGGTWRYKYIDNGGSYDKVNWAVEYEINESPLTQSQLDAINSGITAADVTLIGTALQPGDDVSDLVNDAGYLTSSDVASVAISGDYDDLINKPSIPAAQVQSDWDQSDNTAVDYIKNKPTIPAGVIVDQTYDGTSANAQSGVAIAGELVNYQAKLTSGSNIKTINSTSILGSGNIDIDTIYWATYNSTTFTQIQTAINNGNSVIVKYNNYYLHLILFDGLNLQKAVFFGNNGTTAYTATLYFPSSWSIATSTLATTADIPTNVSAFTNDSGYITSAALSGYATETWVGNQGYLTGITSGDVTTALGYTPYNSSNPDGYITSSALSGYATETWVTNKGYITGITSSDVTTALGYTPYNSTNPSGYQANVIEAIQVNGTAQTVTLKTVDISVPTDTGDLTNNAGYITSSALSGYATESWVGNQGYLTSADVASVAISGDYDDLINKPTIPTKLSDLTVSAGSNVTISGDTISATDTTYSDFVGCDSISAGGAGLVPAPSAGDQAKFLKADGTWDTIPGGGTVDQVYDSTSANAQSGVAIAGAGFLTSIPAGYLKNTATGTNALTLLGTATTQSSSINIGYGSSVTNSESVVIGPSAQSGYGQTVAVGYLANANDSSSTAVGHKAYTNYTQATAIGYDAQATAAGTIAVGSNSRATIAQTAALGFSAKANNYGSTALGYNAQTGANYAIQIGNGTNSTASTLAVGFNGTTYQLLDGTTGLIPDARINSKLIDGQMVSSYLQIDSSTAIHSTKHNLGTTGTGALNYLPADCTTYKYKVFVTMFGSSSSSSLSHGYAANNATAIDGQYGRVSCNANSRHADNSFILEVTNGEMWTSVGDAAFGQSFGVVLLGYKRVGTNS